MAAFLNVGGLISVRSEDIVGIFDIDNTTVSRVTRDFLTKAQKNESVEYATVEIPKSFIVTVKKKERKPAVIISQFSSVTLTERLKRKIQ